MWWRRPSSRSRIVIPLVCLSVLAGAAPSSTKDGLLPGRWHVVVDLKADAANGKRLNVPVGDAEGFNSCVSEAVSGPAKFVSSNALDQGCHAYQAHAANGVISFTAICPTDEDGVSFDMSGSGTYTSERMSLKIDARGESSGNQLALSGTVTANRTGLCRGDEE